MVPLTATVVLLIATIVVSLTDIYFTKRQYESIEQDFDCDVPAQVVRTLANAGIVATRVCINHVNNQYDYIIASFDGTVADVPRSGMIHILDDGTYNLWYDE